MQQMKGMEQQLAMMEEQLRLHNLRVQLQSADSDEDAENDIAISQSHHNIDYVGINIDKPSNWQLTVTNSSEGISLQTSIKDLADINSFLTETLHYFDQSYLPRTPNYHIDRSLQVLTVTNRMLRVESVLYSFFQKKKKMAEDALVIVSIPTYDDINRMFIKRQIIEAYFACMGLLNPVFPKPYYFPLFLANHHVMVTSAMAAFVTYTQCRHVPAIPYPMTREMVGEVFRKEAKELLQDALFEQEPNIYTAATLMFLSQAALITLNNSEARLYMNMAWRMIVDIKPKYADLLSGLTPNTPVTVEIIEAETWRRLFYVIRYLEMSLYVLYDKLSDYSSILFDTGVGYPIVLQIEMISKETRDSVEAFYEVVRVNDCQATRKDDEIRYQLYSGNIENLSVDDLQRLESHLCNFWKSLPPKFQLSDSPFDYLQLDRIQQCDNPYAIYLYQIYYSYWLALHTRLMEEPSATDLEGANMDRYDGDRALMLVSICSDAMSKIFHVLFRRLPCNVEMHWMLIAADAMGRLKKSANPQIKARASINLQKTLTVLKLRVQRSNDGANTQSSDNYSVLKHILPSVISPDGSTSSGSLAGSESDSLYESDASSLNNSASSVHTAVPYLRELQKAISVHLDDEVPTS